jgi:hypothetical protein
MQADPGHDTGGKAAQDCGSFALRDFRRHALGSSIQVLTLDKETGAIIHKQLPAELLKRPIVEGVDRAAEHEAVLAG